MDYCDKALIASNILVGGILSLKELPKGSAWTVITLLSNERLVLMIQMSLAGSPHHHVVWNIADKSGSIFLCDNLLRVLKEIDNAFLSNQPCLIHCAQGQSRSVAVCAAWLISRKHRGNLEDALATIRIARPHAHPNLGFVAALKAIERSGGNVEKAIESWNSMARRRESKLS